MRRTQFLPAAVFAFTVLPAAGAAGDDLVLSEFLAINTGGLADGDGERSDWVEVHNPTASPVSLAGWSLTDDPAWPRKWLFPERVLEAGGFLVVFASGKDLAGPPGEVHASFQLDGDGEHLALVRPDGTTAHAYAPFPRQRENISYGMSMEPRLLVAAGADVLALVPVAGSLGASWTESGFVPGPGWTAGTSGVGFHAPSAGGELPPPVSYWPLDGAFDDAAGSNDASFESAGAPRFVEGRDGRAAGALALEGGQYLDVAQRAGLPIHLQPAYTVALWVRGGPQADKRVFSEGSSTSQSPLFTIGTEWTGASGQVDIFIRGNDGTAIVNHRLSRGIAFDGTWHHLAWVDQGGQAWLSIDGARDGTDFSYTRGGLSLNLTSLGAVLRATACCFFTGAIDDAAVWDRALAPEEVASLAAGGSPLEGLSYDRHLGLDLEAAMRGVNAGAYVRIPFTLPDAGGVDSLLLHMRYDDGFLAYLNGVEVARRNAPAPAAWNAAATAERRAAEALAVEEINLTGRRDALRSGANVLAIHGLNASAGDNDFLVLPELWAAAAAGEPRFFITPSPGAANSGGAAAFVADTSFSHDRGFYDAPFELAITSATPGAVIRYTTDFSEPTEARGQTYAGPIRIQRTTAVRARAFKAGFYPTDVDTHTYLFLEDVIRQPKFPPGLPTVWQTGFTADYEMDPRLGTDPSSPHFEPTIREDLKAIPTLSLVLDQDGLFGPANGIYNHSENRGLLWERAASAEMIHPEGRKGFHVNCGLRMQGGASRDPVRQLKHSFRLLFKAIYGPTKLRHRLFIDSPVEEFDTIVLRCFFTDGWSTRYQEPRYRPDDSQYIRDVWMKDSLAAMGQPSTHNSYVHLYLNGLYWGIYNPAERPDASFQAHHFGGDRESWDVIKDFAEVMNGSKRDWDRMMALAAGGLSSNAAYQAIQGRDPDGRANPALPNYLDVDDLIDFMILHIYAGAEDWPHHNWYAARNPFDPTAGFRFFVWDQEIVLDDLARNRIDVANADTPAYLYARLRQNAEFRLRFADRVHRHLQNDGALTPARNIGRWMRRAAEIDRAVVPESARWGDARRAIPFTRDVEWLAEQRVLVNEYFPQIHPLSLRRFGAAGLYPAVAAPSYNRHGGRVPPGFRLEATAPAGTVYYTLDGSDPRLAGGAVSPLARVPAAPGGNQALVSEGAWARVLVPQDGSLALAWTAPDFDDAAWVPGRTGVGYERTAGAFQDLIATSVLAAMDGKRATVYIRIPFDVQDPQAVGGLTLRMKCDDGFAAYLNGERVASLNAPADPRWDSEATLPRTDAQALAFQDFDLGARRGLLRAGANVLALHGLNYGAASSDLLVLPRLEVPGGAEGGIPIAGTVRAKARALSAGQWSALNEAFFFQDVTLRITEIMYHPPEPPPGSAFGADSFEFIELENSGSAALDLTGLRLEGAVAFEFASGAVRRLLPGELVLVVEDADAFRQRYGAVGMRIAGRYSGSLANRGEEVQLRGPAGEPLLSVDYRDTWAPSTDGGGHSLVIDDPQGDPETWGEAWRWRESRLPGGSPGLDENGGPPAGGLQLPGDSNQDGRLDLADVVSLLLRLFQGGGPAPPCEGTLAEGGNLALLDSSGDARLTLADALWVLVHLFRGGPAPAGGADCVRVPGCPGVCGG